MKCIVHRSFRIQIAKRDPSLMQDYGRDPNFADATIDTMRDQKQAVSQLTKSSFNVEQQYDFFFFFVVISFSQGITTLFNNEK
jgi:hypothetical protein